MVDLKLVEHDEEGWDSAARGAEARAQTQRLLCDETVPRSAMRDPGLVREVEELLDAVGFRLGLVDDRYYAVAADLEDGASGYSEPQLAALALLSVELVVAPVPGQETPRPRISVSEFHRRISDGQGWSKEWLRRAVLGPLERDGYLRVTAPGQRRSAEFIEAGPRLLLIDARLVARALGATS